MELSQLPLMLLLLSNIQSGHAEGKPKAVVVTYPQQELSSTRTNVKCKLPGAEDNWTYSWFKEGSTQSFTSDREFSITNDKSKSSSNVTCRGERKSDNLMSEISDAVTLNLPYFTEIPKAVLKVKWKASKIYRGDTVELECNIEGGKWLYRFKCDGEEEQTSDNDEYNITVQSTLTCQCAGRFSVDSEWSDKVTLIVSDNPEVRINPQNSVFTGDNVTLSCDVGQSTEQHIIWLKNNRRTNIVHGNLKTLTNVQISDGGQYKCKLNDGMQSPAVNLSVTERPKAVLLVQPNGLVFRGQTVTFTCDIQNSDVTHWRYRWTKDHLVIQLTESREYRISSVNESHTGHYSCTGNETEGLRLSHTSDVLTLTVSALGYKEALIIVVTVGLSVLFLLIFLLLLWLYKYKKGDGFLSPSTDQQPHNTSQTSKDKYGEQTKHSDSVNGIPDVTYAEIDMKTKTEMKKNKDNKGNTGETSYTIYSKLKI